MFYYLKRSVTMGMALIFSSWSFFVPVTAISAPADTIAVLDFKASNASASDAATVSGFVRSAFVRAGVYRVVDKENMEKILAEQAFQQAGCTDQGCAVKLGKLLNVKKMVVGEYAMVGGIRFLTASIVEVETGVIERTGKVRGFEPGKVDEAAEKLAEDLMGTAVTTNEAQGPDGLKQEGAFSPNPNLNSPNNLRYEMSDGKIILLWDEVMSASKYRLYILKPGEATYRPHTNTFSSNKVTLKGVFGGYTFAVSAIDANGKEGLMSDPVMISANNDTQGKEWERRFEKGPVSPV